MNTGTPDTSIVVVEFPITTLLPQINGDIVVATSNVATYLLNPVFESTNLTPVNVIFSPFPTTQFYLLANGPFN